MMERPSSLLSSSVSFSLPHSPFSPEMTQGFPSTFPNLLLYYSRSRRSLISLLHSLVMSSSQPHPRSSSLQSLRDSSARLPSTGYVRSGHSQVWRGEGTLRDWRRILGKVEHELSVSHFLFVTLLVGDERCDIILLLSRFYRNDEGCQWTRVDRLGQHPDETTIWDVQVRISGLSRVFCPAWRECIFRSLPSATTL